MACGHTPEESERPFHEGCVAIQADNRLWPLIIPAKLSPLAPAWLPDVRAVVSAYVMGILAKLADHAIRTWLRSKCAEFRMARGHGYDFEKLIDAVGDFLNTHPELMENLEIRDSSLLEFIERAVNAPMRGRDD